MIPIGDSTRVHRVPWITYLFILVNLAVFIGMLRLGSAPAPTRRERVRDLTEQTMGVCYGFVTSPTSADRFICTYGFQPAEFFDTIEGTAPRGAQSAAAVVLTLVTALFLHAGWLHILGNLLFLWVFGDAVEDRLGHLGYGLFLLVGGAVANIAQGAVDTASIVPTVGASGAVAAVLGAYIWLFPRATVHVVIPFFILIFIPIPVPAIVMIGIWFAQNFLAGIATINNAAGADASVAWFAHLGGFAFGLLAAAAGVGREAVR